MNSSNFTGKWTTTVAYPEWTVKNIVLVSLYTFIFVLATTGNILVIWTIVWNKRLRTVTNVFLLNLAVSDLLLSVFCIPFTLVGMLLREFIFGSIICKLLPFFQAVSVAVSVWTLVAISLERYYAICQPLKSRLWQTMNHAYRVIAIVWICSFSLMLPIAALSQLIPTRSPGKVKCREVWPSGVLEKIFNITLDLTLLIVPLSLLLLAYYQIIITLQNGLKIQFPEKTHKPVGMELTENEDRRSRLNLNNSSQSSYFHGISENRSNFGRRQSARRLKTDLARHNLRVNFKSKKKVIRMLSLVVIEFFICWTPLYTVNTIASFDPGLIYILGPIGISLVQLLAFISSCCNPITYCFMYKKFRQGLINACGCHRFTRWKAAKNQRDISIIVNGSSYSSKRVAVKSDLIDSSIDISL